MAIYIIPTILAIIIYLPIFLLAIISKKFKSKFMQVHSKTESEKIEEIFVGLIYFLFFIFLLFKGFTQDMVLFSFGIALYVVSLFLTYSGYVAFYKSKKDELIKDFPYNFSRNPTYFYGLLALLGIIISTSYSELILLLLLQFFLTHRIILNEEDYCKKRYEHEYLNYLRKVKRYF